MKKIFMTATAVCLASVGALAQMQFTKTAHDFGQIPEAGGEATYLFEFTNVGKAPVIITNVESSCGCTTPEWSREPVLPGKTGFVKAIFDPKDRPGIFDKEITVSATAGQQVKLKISGEVIPKAKGIADLYPRVVGTLRLKSLNIPFANIYSAATVVDSLPVVNTGSAAVSIAFENVPPHLTLSVRPQTLNPGEKGSITCTYNAAKKSDWGYVTDKVSFTLGGGKSRGELSISATIDEDFSGLTGEQLSNAPVASLARRSIDLGSVSGSAAKEFTISIANSGKSDLLLRKVSTNCSCITLSDDNPKVVKAGQSAELKATFRAASLKGKVSKTVTVITNAPRQPNAVVRVSAAVN
ncbi:MAG: DUF1573 domain-containing protein [Prevotellaceae bacterium]|nr:DUF1573 domain-containing protein [Prevotellaceae bacterium]